MNNLNADFLLDIWADLKAKKLAPIAIGLIVAVVAMPALLLTGGGDAPAGGPVPVMAPASADTAEVELAQELAEGDSKLDSYKAHNPFDGLVKPQSDGPTGGSGSAIAPSDLVGKGGDDGADLPSLGGGGGGGSTAPDSLTPIDTGSGGPGLDSTGGTPQIIRRPGSKFTYQLDVKFGRPGREKHYPHLARMSFLPNPDVPALLFMGVPQDAKSALFFVHPTLSHAGEGVCIPSKTNCNFLKLAVGREHFLSVNDYEFRIKLLGIDRVKLSTERKQREAQRKMSRRSQRGTGDTPLGDAAEQYEWPMLVDGIG